MAESTAVGPGASGGAGESAERGGLSNRVIWSFVAVGILLSVVSLRFTTDNARSFLFDILAVVAAYADLGSIATLDSQRGAYLSLQASF